MLPGRRTWAEEIVQASCIMWLAVSLAANQGEAAARVTQPPPPLQLGAVVAPTGTIRGHIVEARTGAPLAAVLLQVQSTNQRALSDEDGRFELSDVPGGPQVLLVSVVGYGLVRREVVVPPGDVVELTLPVAEGASTYVEQVTVRGSAFREAESGVVSQTLLGSRDLLALRGLVADDPFRAVQSLPGVATGDDFKAEFAIRGQGPQHLGLSIDGVDSPLLFHTVRGVEDTGSLALINSDLLESASVVAGARPQRLNAHLGAAVDLTTRDGASDRFRARAMLSVTAATTVWEGPIGGGSHGSWLLAARQSYVDWLLGHVDPDVTATFGFSDAQAKLTWRVTPRQWLRATIVGGRSLLRERDDETGRNSLDRGTNRTLIANLQWQFAAAPTLTVSQQVYAVDAEYRNRVPDGRAREEGSDRDVTWRGRVEWIPRARHLVEVGGQAQSFRATRVDRTFRPTTVVVNLATEGRGSAAAAWMQTRWTILPDFVVTPGMRLDHWEVSASTAGSPWLLAEWQAGPATRLRGGVAVQRQAPSIEQSTLAAAGAPLVPERARTIDLGVEQRFGEAWRATVSAYLRTENDRLRLLRGEPSAPRGIFVPVRDPRWRNTMTGEARGAGVSLERRSVNGVSGWIGYSYDEVDLTDEITGETFPSDYDQRHTLNAYAIYRHSSRTSLSARLRLGSNFPLPGYYRQVGSEYYIAAERNQVRLPEYGRLDVRADRAFTYRRSRLTLFAEVVNASNRRNVAPADPSINTSTLRAQGATERLFPRLPLAGLLLEF